ncbi:MAG: rhodanese-like domain-containing protein [Hyphomicrobiaceae bacterium]|jgi:rhodanese-related sulfurtransferase
MAASIDAKTLKQWLSDGEEMAFLDVREPGQFAEGHAFFAVPLAYSRFELDVERLVPNRSVRMVLCDAGDGVAERTQKRAEALGYANISILQGGAPAWGAAGYTLYEGVNLPSKTFGELIEHVRHTPRITAEELVSMRQRGDDFVLVDGRTWDEYQRFNIPGGIACPNGELPLRIGRIAPDPKTTIVVNCAGRTRSIIGAQTLIDFGVPNRAVALENGTQGWYLAGLEVERGADRRWPDAPTDEAERAPLRANARRHGEHHGVAAVTAADVLTWLRDESRSTYLFDVRTAEEFAADARPGFAHAPGGQLVQATDQWVGVKGARIVLSDHDGIRAPMTAAWLRQLGHEAFLLSGAVEPRSVLADALSAKRADAALPNPPTVIAAKAATLLEPGEAQVLDLRASAAYRDAHVPGSRWAVRPRLAAAAITGKTIILVTDDTGVARAAALDLAEAGCRDVRVLEGGFAAWQADGRPVEASPGQPPDSERIDFIFHTLGRNDGNLDAARAYLAWEINLVKQLDAQELGVFRIGH